MNPSEPPSGVLDPKHPWYSNSQVGEQTWRLLKLKLTGGKGSDGTQYSSFVNLTDADADKLIKNLKKDPRGYPQLNQTGGMGGYENLQKYQEWLVEEYLEKPFMEQVNKKIEDDEIESRLKEIEEERKKKAQTFVSGATAFRTGKKISVKTGKISGLIPKRAIPTKVVDTISKPVGEESVKASTNIPQEVITSFGRIAFDVELATNNLDKLLEILQNDYKQAKEINKKEVEDYRKRVANRGRIIGKRELGDNKSDLSGLIKKYVGSFFSGTGGAIRALSGLNLVQGIVEGNPGKIIGSLAGITASYLPAIGMAVGGKVVESMGKKLFTGGRRASRGMRGLSGEMRPLSRIRGGGRLALGAGLATAAGIMVSKIFGGGGESDRVRQDISSKSGMGFGTDSLMPQDSIKRFDDINKKFEQAVDRLLSGPGPGSYTPPSSDGGLTQDVTSAVSDPKVRSFLDTIANVESGGRYNVSVGGKTFNSYSKHPEMFDPSLGSDAAGRYQFISTTFNPIAKKLGLKDFSPQSQDIAAVQYLKDLGVLDDIQSGDPRRIQTAIDMLKNKWTGLKRYKAGEALKYYNQRLRSGGLPAMPTLPSPPNRERVALTPPPSTSGPVVLPVPVNRQTQSPASASVAENNVVPSISTTYSENFLALYSKLIYQIV